MRGYGALHLQGRGWKREIAAGMYLNKDCDDALRACPVAWTEDRGKEAGGASLVFLNSCESFIL